MLAVDPAIAEAVDRAVDGLLTLCQASERLVNELRHRDPAEYDTAHVEALRTAVCLELSSDGTFRGGYVGASATPRRATLAEVPAEVFPVWQVYAEHTHHSWLRAHLHDLLKEAGVRPIHQHARAAIIAYRETVPSFLASAEQARGRLRAVRSLTRALALAVEMNQRDLRGAVEGEILTLASDLLAVAPVPFGLVLELTEAMQSRRAQPEAVKDLIERAISVCSETLLVCRFLHLLQDMERDPVARKAIDARIVEAMTERAGRSPGAERMTWRADAATVARDAGLSEQHREILLAMQEERVEDLGLVPMARVAVPFTEQDRADAVAVIDQAADFAGALWLMVGEQPPAGTVREARTAATGLLAGDSFGMRIARGALNPAGPVPVGPASDDTLANLQAEYQLLQLRVSGLALVEQLNHVHERFQPGAEELAAVFGHPILGSRSKAQMLIHAFQYFWAGQDDVAVHLALPRVEALLREIERARGVPVLSVAKGATPGGMSQLGALIAAMPQAGFNQDWSRSLALVLHDGERGWNLRNDVGHGLCDCPPRHQVALVLHAAVFLLAAAHGVITLPQPEAAGALQPVARQ